jgi:hypothetical protein
MDRYSINNHEPSKRIQVIDNQTGNVIKSWSYRAFEGEGVTQSIRIKNANKNAQNYIKSITRRQAIAGDDFQYDPETGLYTTPDGRSFSTPEEARQSIEELRRRQQLEETEAKTEEQLGELEQLIRRSSRAQRQMAERVGARQTGQLMSQLERSILGAGGEAQALEALAPSVQERAERSLLDRLTGIEAQTAQQLQRVPQLALGQATTMAGLQQTQQQIQDQMARALMREETTRAQIQAGLDQEPEWWESILSPVSSALGTAAGTYLGSTLFPTATAAAAPVAATAAPAVVASDMQVKENISKVGSLDNGLPVYLFNYKGSKTPQIGLMAQDVEKVNKDAVIEIDGIKHVYYGKAVK